MAKKGFMVLVLAALVAGVAFAQSGFKPSIGVGGYFTSDFGGGFEAKSGDETASMKTPYTGGGGFVFFDAAYADVSLGFFGGGGKTKTEPSDDDTPDVDMSYMGLDLGLLAKFPVTMSGKLTVFPLLGITYRVMLSVKAEDEKADDPGNASALWFKLGGGLDFSFTSKVFLRGSVLYGIRLANKTEKDLVDSFKDMPGVEDPKSLLGHGLEVKLAIGCRL